MFYGAKGKSMGKPRRGSSLFFLHLGTCFNVFAKRDDYRDPAPLTIPDDISRQGEDVFCRAELPLLTAIFPFIRSGADKRSLSVLNLMIRNFKLFASPVVPLVRG